MDNLFLEEFVNEAIDPNTIKEIQIFDNNNTFENNNILEELDEYDINTETIIHKQENLSENNNKDKIYDISSLYTEELRKEKLLISYNDINASLINGNFNGSYEYQFNLNKTYNNVIGIILNKAIYEYSASNSTSSIYLDVIINNIPSEACINNLNGYNIIKRIHYDHTYSSGSGVGYSDLYSNPNYFYPVNLNKLNMELKNNINPIDILGSFNNQFNLINTTNIGKFSFEFELTLLNR
jgi:hypothetical protein